MIEEEIHNSMITVRNRKIVIGVNIQHNDTEFALYANVAFCVVSKMELNEALYLIMRKGLQ